MKLKTFTFIIMLFTPTIANATANCDSVFVRINPSLYPECVCEGSVPVLGWKKKCYPAETAPATTPEPTTPQEILTPEQQGMNKVIENALTKYCVPSAINKNCNPLRLADYDPETQKCKCRDTNPRAAWFPELRVCDACEENEYITEAGCENCGEHVEKCDVLTGEIQQCEAGYYIADESKKSLEEVCENKTDKEPHYTYKNCRVSECEEKTLISELIPEQENQKANLIEQKNKYIADIQADGETINEDTLNTYDIQIASINATIKDYQSRIYNSAKETAARNLQDQKERKAAVEKVREKYISETPDKTSEKETLIQQRDNYISESQEKMEAGEVIDDYDVTVENFNNQISELEKYITEYNNTVATYDGQMSIAQNLITQYQNEYNNAEEESICSCELDPNSAVENANCSSACEVEITYKEIVKPVCEQKEVVVDTRKCNECPNGYYCADGINKSQCSNILQMKYGVYKDSGAWVNLLLFPTPENFALVAATTVISSGADCINERSSNDDFYTDWGCHGKKLHASWEYWITPFAAYGNRVENYHSCYGKCGGKVCLLHKWEDWISSPTSVCLKNPEWGQKLYVNGNLAGPGDFGVEGYCATLCYDDDMQIHVRCDKKTGNINVWH